MYCRDFYRLPHKGRYDYRDQYNVNISYSECCGFLVSIRNFFLKKFADIKKELADKLSVSNKRQYYKPLLRGQKKVKENGII